VAAYYFDSSAVVERYIRETGTAWVRSICRSGTTDPIYVARITAVEVCSAVARRAHGGSFPVARAAVALARFRKHLIGRYRVVELTPGLTDSAMRLAESHGLRAYDAVQLAAALEVNAGWISANLGGVMLISADQALNAAAGAEGMLVDDPSLHP
jgi:predicted nucleic acid-binding protein